MTRAKKLSRPKQIMYIWHNLMGFCKIFIQSFDDHNKIKYYMDRFSLFYISNLCSACKKKQNKTKKKHTQLFDCFNFVD